jgi:[ribosomal protein S5]-alanine N-acetyltransferase
MMPAPAAGETVTQTAALRNHRRANYSKAMTLLTTPRLRLRPAQPSDLEAIHAILSDWRAMRYWSTLPHTDIAQSREWLADMIASPADLSCDFIVECDGQVIGKAGCWRLPSVGYILHPDWWGRGLATEALTAAIAHVFATHPVEELTADVDPRNTASLALLARLGFHEAGRGERTWLIGGEWCDSVYLALGRGVISPLPRDEVRPALSPPTSSRGRGGSRRF